MPEPLSKTQLAHSLVGFFPPMLRASVLEDAQFRKETGLKMQANIRLNQSGLTFDRATLYAAIKEALASQDRTIAIETTDGKPWRISKNGSGAVVVSTEATTVPLPDFECLSEDATVRLRWFERQNHEFDIDDAAARKWRDVLAARSCDDDEVEDLRAEFRLTPRWFVGTLLQGAEDETDLPISSLVPSDPRYYYRLAGCPVEKDLFSFIKSDLAGHIDRQIVKAGINGVGLALLLSAHSSIPQQIRLNSVARSEVKTLFEWIEAHGDRISQLGAIELGLAHLDVYPELEPSITKIIRAFIEVATDEDGRLAQLAGLVVLVDGELARTGILRQTPPYWRRLAAIAHASLLERELLRRGVSVSDFSKWAYPNRGQLYFYQTNVDLRKEPRWLADFLSADQLKAEFVGRIATTAILNEGKINSPELRSIALDKDGPLQSLIVFPAPFLPGPLEGGVEATNPMTPEMEKKVYEDLKAEVVTSQSFTGLVNTSLIFRLGPHMADLAAEALRRTKYQLRGFGANASTPSLLYGLAIVSAVTRSEALAAEVRVLVRVVRRRPDPPIDVGDTVRIALVAAAAYPDIDKWCSFLGEWLTELSYEDMDRSGASALWRHIRGLCQIERRLWGTCARADAACASLSAA